VHLRSIKSSSFLLLELRKFKEIFKKAFMISSIRKILEFKSGAQTILTRKNKGVMKNYLRNYKEIYNFDLKP